MTLVLRQVAICDECGERHVFDSPTLYECRTALHAMRWRFVVRDKGRELLCCVCVEKLDADELARVTAKAGGVAPEVRLTQGRRRLGGMVCPGCGGFVEYKDAYYEPLAKEHPLNLRCLTCCAKSAARRGYRIDLDKYLPREEVPAPEGEAQGSLI